MSERIGCSEHRALCSAAAQCLFTASTKPKSGGERKTSEGCTTAATVPLLSESSSGKV